MIRHNAYEPNKTEIAIGGLLRCCLANIAEQLDARETVETNDRLVTHCCGEAVRLDSEGVWRWEG